MSAVLKNFDGSVDNVQLSVLVVNSDYTIRYANPAAHRMLGYPQGSMVGGSIEHLMPEHRRTELRNVGIVLSRRSPCRFRSQVMRADGRLVEVALTMEPETGDSDHGPAVTLSLNPLPPWGEKSRLTDSNEITLRHSGVREAPKPQDEGETSFAGPERIARALDMLSWLDQRLAAPTRLGSLDEPRERARISKVLADVRELLNGPQEG
jgi:PAS domain S-box-containing protein